MAMTEVIMSRQMSAGNVPPSTGWPWYSVFMYWSRSGYPTQTAAV